MPRARHPRVRTSLPLAWAWACACAPVLVLAALGCSSRSKEPAPAVDIATQTSKASAPDPVEPAAAFGPRAGEAVLFGVIHERGTPFCPDAQRADPEWKSRFFSAGFVPLVGEIEPARALHGKAAVLIGTPSDHGPPHDADVPTPRGDCPPYQMRSDWEPSPDGMLVRRAGGPTMAGFAVRTARAFSGLTARAASEGVVVELDNPLDLALERVSLVAHYEGCYGKPGTVSETRELGHIAPHGHAKTVVGAFATEADAPRGRGRHVLFSVALVSDAPGVYFDLDVPLGALGLELTCREDGARR